ncbi:MAG: FHA domain-containing protein [Candidatus Pacearchaeota archaeon]|jgi:hypothetical protein
MKPKILLDVITNYRHILLPDNKVLSIGRLLNSDILIPPNQPNLTYAPEIYDIASKVSREHALIRHDNSGSVFLTHKSKKNSTYIGSRFDPYEEEVFDTIQIFPGQYITLGVSYRFFLDQSKDLISLTNSKEKFRKRETNYDIDLSTASHH